MSGDPDLAETDVPYAYAGDDPVNSSDPSGQMVSVLGVGGYGPTTCQTPFSTCQAGSLIPAATAVGQALRSAIAAQAKLAAAEGQQLGGLGICSTNPNRSV
ncbi:MAG TPA: hypothetical protein VMS00_11425 [Acidimicrobiales bacterium]|nr:hypothetical protein [Acidimicrobiales bacterium]